MPEGGEPYMFVHFCSAYTYIYISNINKSNMSARIRQPLITGSGPTRIQKLYMTISLPESIGLGLWCLTPLSTTFQLYCGGQYYGLLQSEYPEKTTDSQLPA